jgi:DNA helicase HerA-like ATPase
MEPGSLSSTHTPVGTDFTATTTLTYRFRVTGGNPLFIGELLRIEDVRTGCIFFARLTDLHHVRHAASGSSAPGSGEGDAWSEEEAEAVPLGFVDESGGFQPPGFIPAAGSPVSRPGAEDLAFIRAVMGDIEIGALKSGRGIISGFPVSLSASIIPRHIGVFGTTGLGKSNFIKVFAASCMKGRSFGLLVVDTHGEYAIGSGRNGEKGSRGLIHLTEHSGGLSIYSIRPDEDRKKYGMKPLALEYGDFRMSDLSLIFQVSDPMWEIIESLDPFPGQDIIDFFMDEGVDSLPSEFKTTSKESRFPFIVNSLRSSTPGNLKGVQSRVESLVRESSAFFRRSGSSLPGIISDLQQNRVVVVDIPLMGESIELFLLSAIARGIMRTYQENALIRTGKPGKEEQTVLIAIEEAQRVLSSGGHRTHVFSECAMEGRKFGVGLCVVTQQPKNIDKRVLAQVNTYVVMGLSDREDRAIISRSAKHDLSRLDTEIQTLMRGDAIISTSGISFPISTRIHLFEDYISGRT